MVVRVIVSMPAYCKVCGYDCCRKCYYHTCKKSWGCEAYPISFLIGEKYNGPFGLLGLNSRKVGWGKVNCSGLNIKLFDDSLGDILKRFLRILNTEKDVAELSDQGVVLRMVPATREEVKRSTFNLKLYNVFCGLYAQNFL